jgi:hypothetical protein
MTAKVEIGRFSVRDDFLIRVYDDYSVIVEDKGVHCSVLRFTHGDRNVSSILGSCKEMLRILRGVRGSEPFWMFEKLWGRRFLEAAGLSYKVVGSSIGYGCYLEVTGVVDSDIDLGEFAF